jgi:type IV pilus assembly protein PilA
MRKGFTLIEMLAVIIILGILAALAIPPIVKNMDQAREAAYEQTINNIEQTTQFYIRDNKQYMEGITTIDNRLTITLQDLVDKENLKTPVMDSRTDREISLETQINILVKALNQYEVTVGTIIYAE